MAKMISSTKEMLGIKFPVVNVNMLRTEAKSRNGGMTEVVNEAIYEWLKARGYEPEVNIDGREGRWRRVKVDGSDE